MKNPSLNTLTERSEKPRRTKKERFEDTLQILSDAKYKIEKNLSSGSFGVVVTVRRPASTELEAAKLVEANSSSSVEMNFWKTLAHPHILPLEETVYIPKLQTYTFISPLLQMTLDEKLQSSEFLQDPNGLELIKKWFFEILSAFQYLHENRMCHADLKSDNILISREPHAVLCDFTFVAFTTKPLERYGAPFPYFPPEACESRNRSNFPRPPVDGVQLDLWLFGMMALEVFTKDNCWNKIRRRTNSTWNTSIYPLLFEEVENLQIRIRSVLPAVNFQRSTLKTIKNFIVMFLRPNPAARPSAQEAIKHKFFGGKFKADVDKVWIKKKKFKKIEGLVEKYIVDFESSNVYGKREAETKSLPKNYENYRFIEMDESSIDEEVQSEGHTPKISTLDDKVENQAVAVNEMTNNLNSPLGSCEEGEIMPSDEIEHISTTATDGNPGGIEFENEQSAKKVGTKSMEKSETLKSSSQEQMQEIECSKEQTTQVEGQETLKIMEMAAIQSSEVYGKTETEVNIRPKSKENYKLTDIDALSIDKMSRTESGPEKVILQSNIGNRQDVDVKETVGKLNSPLVSIKERNGTQPREEIEHISTFSSTNENFEGIEFEKKHLTKLVETEIMQNTVTSDSRSQQKMQDIESDKKQTTELEILQDCTRVDLAEPKMEIQEAGSNKHASPPSDNSETSECEDITSSVKPITCPKCETFELSDMIWEKIIINLLTQHLSTPKDSCAGSARAEFCKKIEHVLTAFFSNRNHEGIKLENKQTFEKVGAENPREDDIEEFNTTLQVRINEVDKQQQAEASRCENFEKVDIVERKKQPEVETIELLQPKSIGSKEQKFNLKTEPNKNASNEKGLENLQVSEEAVKPKEKRTSGFRKFCCRISNCKMCFLKLFCCKSQRCRKGK